MRCSLSTKIRPNTKERGRVLIHIPGVWPNPSARTSNVHAYRERLMLIADFFCGQTSECLLNSKRYIFTLKSLTGALSWTSMHGLGAMAVP